MCLFAGAGRIVCASTKLQTSVRPFAFEIPLKLAAAPHLFPARFTVPKEKPAPIGLTAFVAGCTIGSVCPRCPYRDRVPSLHKSL